MDDHRATCSGRSRSTWACDLESASGDEVVATWTARPELHQPYGIVHGGVHAAVVETLASVGAAVWMGERGKVVGVSNNTDFYQAVTRRHAHLDRHPAAPRPLPAGLARREPRRRRPSGRARSGPAPEPDLSGYSLFIGFGTLVNVVTVLVGATIGVLVGHRLPERTRTVVTDGLGLVTLLIAATSAAAHRERRLGARPSATALRS